MNKKFYLLLSLICCVSMTYGKVSHNNDIVDHGGFPDLCPWDGYDDDDILQTTETNTSEQSDPEAQGSSK